MATRRSSCASSAGASSPTTCCSTIPDLATRNFQPRFDAFPWRDDDAGAARLAARPDRLSDRRRRHARALADRLDAQPRAHDRGLVPGQAPADRLAQRRGLVLGHAGRCRSRQQCRELAVGRRLAAPMPRPISASSIRCCRARSSIPTATTCAAGCRNSPGCPPRHIHAPWDAPASVLAAAKLELGRDYPGRIIDLDEGRAGALAAFDKGHQGGVTARGRRGRPASRRPANTPPGIVDGATQLRTG